MYAGKGLTLFIPESQNGLSATDWLSREISTLLHITSDRGFCWWGWGVSGTAIKDGGVSCEQKKLRQGLAFIVHEQGLYSKAPQGPAQQRWTHLHSPLPQDSNSFGHQTTTEIGQFSSNETEMTEDWNTVIEMWKHEMHILYVLCI